MVKKIYNKRIKSKRALAIDKGRTTKKVFPNTPSGRKEYKNHTGYADLAGFDTITKDSQLKRWNKTKTKTYQYEKKSSDYIDYHALEDSTLTAKENKENLRKLYRNNIRF